MTVIGYVSVFVSIVLGLAVAELGSSFHKLMRARHRVRWDWMSLALAYLMLLQIVDFWWLSHDWYAQRAQLRIIEFLPNLVLILLIYLMAAAVLPDEVPEKGIDLRQFYIESSSYFWTLAMLMGIAIITILGPSYSGSSDLVVVAKRESSNLVILAGFALLLFVRNIRFHQLAIIAFAGFVTWTYLSGARNLH